MSSKGENDLWDQLIQNGESSTMSEYKSTKVLNVKNERWVVTMKMKCRVSPQWHSGCHARMSLILCWSLRRWSVLLCLGRGRLDLPSSIALSMRVPLVWVRAQLCVGGCSPGFPDPKKSVIGLCDCRTPCVLSRPSLCRCSSSRYKPRHLWSSYFMTLCRGPKPSLNKQWKRPRIS